MTDQYFTIDKLGEGLYKEKGSKFISYILPISKEEEVKQHVNEFKQKYYDARHVCYAYILGFESEIQKGSDSGEPSGTAGLPILNVLKSKAVTNILAIVVRYFGGTKLGVSGLIEAYKGATEDSFLNCEIIPKFAVEGLSFIFPYEQTSFVQQIISDYSIEIIHQSFEANCAYELAVRASYFEEVKQKLSAYGS